MNNAHRFGWELGALWSLAVVLVAGAVFVVWLTQAGDVKADIAGIVINGLMLALAQTVNSIRNLGTSRAMQTMVEQLGQSQPAITGEGPSSTP